MRANETYYINVTMIAAICFVIRLISEPESRKIRARCFSPLGLTAHAMQDRRIAILFLPEVFDKAEQLDGAFSVLLAGVFFFRLRCF
jgi:hypothetical protein